MWWYACWIVRPKSCVNWSFCCKREKEGVCMCVGGESVYVCGACVCACVCVREREWERYVYLYIHTCHICTQIGVNLYSVQYGSGALEATCSSSCRRSHSTSICTSNKNDALSTRIIHIQQLHAHSTVIYTGTSKTKQTRSQFVSLCYLWCSYFTGWQRPIGCLIFIGHFSQKSPIISGSFAKNDLQLKALSGSSPPWRVACSSSRRRRHSTNSMHTQQILCALIQSYAYM